MQIFFNPIFRNNDYIVHQRPNYSLNSSISYLGNTKFMTKNEILIILPFSVWLEDWWTIRMWSTLCEFCSRRDSLPWTKWLKKHRPALPLLLLLTLRLLHTTNLGSLCQDRVDSLLHWFVVCYFFPSNNSIEFLFSGRKMKITKILNILVNQRTYSIQFLFFVYSLIQPLSRPNWTQPCAVCPSFQSSLNRTHRLLHFSIFSRIHSLP